MACGSAARSVWHSGKQGVAGYSTDGVNTPCTTPSRRDPALLPLNLSGDLSLPDRMGGKASRVDKRTSEELASFSQRLGRYQDSSWLKL